MLVEDIISSRVRVSTLKVNSNVSDFEELAKETGYQRFPVVDEWNRVIGIISRKDVEDMPGESSIEKLLTRHPITAGMQTSLASAAQIMMWEGIDFLPIVDRNRKLISSVTRKEVLQAMRDAQNQPQLGETFEHLMWNGFAEERGEDGRLFFHGMITPQMSTNLGTISQGVLTALLSQAGLSAAKDANGNDHIVDNLTTYFVRPVQIENPVVISPVVLEVSRRACKLEIAMTHQDSLVAKAVMTLQSIDHA
ncbi:inosine 5'-monophosphate dehydrogenase [compost metagenome]